MTGHCVSYRDTVVVCIVAGDLSNLGNIYDSSLHHPELLTKDA